MGKGEKRKKIENRNSKRRKRYEDFSDQDNKPPVSDSEDEDGMGEDTGLAAKIARQLKFLRQKTGGVEDETYSDTEEEDEKKCAWSRSKNIYYGGDDYEIEQKRGSAHVRKQLTNNPKKKYRSKYHKGKVHQNRQVRHI